MKTRRDLVFLFDVDNTLLDNDRVQGDLFRHLARRFGPKARDRYGAIFEELRTELGYADYLGALERYRLENLHDPRLLSMANWLVDYPFTKRLYPGALEVVARVRRWGQVAILSDGDAVFQPRKVQRSGLWRAFGGNVLIFVHKENELHAVERFYPAKHYVMVDDKLRILQAIKDIWKERVTTVFPKQGHYARDKNSMAKYRPADVGIQRIADLLDFKRTAFLGE
jgi:FMN phosphatase YigB (HAD superfamily)